ncbi:MurR/RpiR family transcriptional regulator [Cohnella rhizosphaerae]|uniref:MurR/RpiR family transcriptional regulator n=1 Tax=Cohnella rhizosphaerae TaxID=1457232 RepID=A0A9X4KXF3_9BACL|nr:MurR/RpiR family transcriptional regulator [Cohnella rhizosphaerae]MDG0809812.1 MurR/RpiR family transcriptional regulator [Cohnella rhizosphaerae]
MSRRETLQPGSNTLLMLSSMYNSLSKTEKKIADIIKSEPESVVYSTLTDLAEKARTGDTSVLRLCRKLGFSGYQEFKLTLAQELVTTSRKVHSEIEDGDDLSTIAEKITAENKMFIENTFELLDMNELQKAINAIAAARKITFFGIGSSSNTAADAKHRFMRIGFNTELVTDSHVMAMAATLMDHQDVVFAVSTSGSTKDIVDAVRIAKSNGCYFICLTSQAKSPVTLYADAVLLSCAKESPLQGGAFQSKLAQIHVLDILTTATVLQNKEKAYKAIEQTSKGILDKLY